MVARFQDVCLGALKGYWEKKHLSNSLPHCLFIFCSKIIPKNTEYKGKNMNLSVYKS